jgi:hypothetical protein
MYNTNIQKNTIVPLENQEIIMEKWRRVWREGLATQITYDGLRALQAALMRDDPRLMQGAICSPPTLDALRDRPIACACAIGYCGWQGEGCATVGELEEYFHRICDAADAIFQEPAACRFFLNWFDETPRALMRRELLGEVTHALRQSELIAA